MKQRIWYTVTSACTRCGMCALECPAAAIRITEGRAVIDRVHCTGCGHCCENCTFEAIERIEYCALAAGALSGSL